MSTERSYARLLILISCLLLASWVASSLAAETAAGTEGGASWAPTNAAPPESHQYNNHFTTPTAEEDESLTETENGDTSSTDAEGMMALSKALQAAGAAEVEAGSLRFSDLINSLLSSRSSDSTRTDAEKTGGEANSTTTPPWDQTTIPESVYTTTPVLMPMGESKSGPVDEGVELGAGGTATTVKHSNSGANGAQQLSAQADGRSSTNCRSSCGNVFKEHDLCSSGWEGQSALCGRGFRGIPGLEPREDHCLRCISGVCGECPEGYQAVEEMGVCRAHGECAWGQCSRKSSCSVGYTARDSKVCRVGSFFLSKNYCCEDKPKQRCCQALPCQQYSQDCQYWGCDPACRFAVYSLPQACKNPYNADLKCGSGIELDGLEVSKAQEAALKPEVGTCLEMLEICGEGCPDGYTEQECPWPRCETAKANTCTHTAGLYNRDTNSFTKKVTHCWRRQSCGVSNAPSECQRPVQPVADDLTPTLFDVVKGENENDCPLFWSENPKCTTWDGRVNECGVGMGEAPKNSPLGAQQGTCFQEVEVCGETCPDGYTQLPCGFEGCPDCHWDGRKGLKCVKRHACIPSFSQCDATSTDSNPPTGAMEGEKQDDLRTVVEEDETRTPGPPPFPEPPREQTNVPDAAAVDLPSELELSASPRKFAGLEIDFFFLDLDLTLLQEPESRFDSAFLSRMLRESRADMGRIASIEAGSVLVTLWLEYSAGSVPSDAFIRTLMDDPQGMLRFLNWHDTLRSLGRVVATRIEYIFMRNPPPPPPQQPPSPPPSPPQPFVNPRDEDARAAANFSDLQPINGMDGVDGLDGSKSPGPGEVLEPVDQDSEQAHKNGASKTGLSTTMLTALIIAAGVVVVGAAICAFVFMTRRDRRKQRKREVEAARSSRRAGATVPPLPTGAQSHGQPTPPPQQAPPNGGLQTARSHTFEFATGEEDVVIIDQSCDTDECDAVDVSGVVTSTIVVNTTGQSIPVANGLGATRSQRESQRSEGSANHEGESQPPASLMTLEAQQQQRLNTLMVPFNSMVIKQQLSRGSLKNVYRGFWNGYIPVTIHKVISDREQQTPACILANVQPHPNLVQLFGVSQDVQGSQYLVMEFVRQGPLDAFLADHPVTFQTKIEIAIQVCLAMRHLSDAGVVHGSLAAHNVLVENSEPMLVKVSDYGLVPQALRNVSSPTAEALPLRWVSPEVWSSGSWSEKSDVWAFAIMLWELHSFTIPYGRLTSDAEVVKFLEAGGRLPKPNYCPDSLYDIMRACWLPNPQERPTFGQLLEILTNIRMLL